LDDLITIFLNHLPSESVSVELIESSNKIARLLSVED